MSSQWVQHISGQGEKWELTEYELADSHESDLDYEVYTRDPDDKYFYLPKSEYRPCKPPERWVDVTSECIDRSENMTLWECGESTYIHVAKAGRLRLRKIEINQHDYKGMHWAFIVERKMP